MVIRVVVLASAIRAMSCTSSSIVSTRSCWNNQRHFTANQRHFTANQRHFTANATPSTDRTEHVFTDPWAVVDQIAFSGRRRDVTHGALHNMLIDEEEEGKDGSMGGARTAAVGLLGPLPPRVPCPFATTFPAWTQHAFVLKR